MQYSILSALVLGLSAIAEATFSKPRKGDQWTIGQSQTITWETTELAQVIDINIVSAVDTTVVITQIASQIRNTGSFVFTPTSLFNVNEVAIQLIDIRRTVVVSQSFTIIAVKVSILEPANEYSS
jgi:hypothetical protein